MAYGCILVETRGPVGLITFNRPDALNAFNDQLMTELTEALQAFEADDSVGAMVITGSEKAFAAGADIKEMQKKTFADVFTEGLVSRNWEEITRCRKPVIAAVSGYALGGGNEVAMMCDIILASPTAKFGQPEIRIGTIPGAGGTQRLTRAVGKAKAMDMILSGRNMTAEEAETMGLVSRIVPTEDLLEEALGLAKSICGMSRPAVMLAKEAINRAFETSLSEGVLFERRAFHATFSTEDQKEGMTAFAEKRSPDFRNR